MRSFWYSALLLSGCERQSLAYRHTACIVSHPLATPLHQLHCTRLLYLHCRHIPRKSANKEICFTILRCHHTSINSCYTVWRPFQAIPRPVFFSSVEQRFRTQVWSSSRGYRTLAVLDRYSSPLIDLTLKHVLNLKITISPSILNADLTGNAL